MPFEVISENATSYFLKAICCNMYVCIDFHLTYNRSTDLERSFFFPVYFKNFFPLTIKHGANFTIDELWWSAFMQTSRCHGTSDRAIHSSSTRITIQERLPAWGAINMKRVAYTSHLFRVTWRREAISVHSRRVQWGKIGCAHWASLTRAKIRNTFIAISYTVPQFVD